jgi:L-ectoine synthase
MKTVRIQDIEETEREVHCPRGGFISYRALLERDGMGFSMHKTVIPKGTPQHWHYKHHFEACYCIKGRGILTNLDTGDVYAVEVDTVYVLDNNDDHTFEALEDTVLISVFNPPVTGNEVHGPDGSYTNNKHDYANGNSNDHWER